MTFDKIKEKIRTLEKLCHDHCKSKNSRTFEFEFGIDDDDSYFTVTFVRSVGFFVHDKNGWEIGGTDVFNLEVGQTDPEVLIHITNLFYKNQKYLKDLEKYMIKIS